jgi:hypothetical protein
MLRTSSARHIWNLHCSHAHARCPAATSVGCCLAAIIADYDAQSAVERELVLRLVSLLWRLRRATTMETGLFEIQADHLREFKQDRQIQPEAQEIICAGLGWAHSADADPERASQGITNGTEARSGSGPEYVDPATNLARCFLRLANLPTYPLDRLSRYEAILWRQAGQILLALDALDRRKPQERKRRFHIGSRQDPAGRWTRRLLSCRTRLLARLTQSSAETGEQSE